MKPVLSKSKRLKLAGMIFGLSGVILLFFYGWPQPSFEKGITLGMDSPQVEVHDAKVHEMEKTYRCNSIFGCVLLVVGIVFEIIAKLAPEATRKSGDGKER